MTVGVRQHSNPEITSSFGELIEKSQARLKGLRIEDFRPATGTIVVRQCDAAAITDGGIHLPDSAQERPSLGTVVAVNTDPDCPWKVGDLVVMRSEASGLDLSLERGEVFKILQYHGSIEDEIVGSFPVEALDSLPGAS